MRLPPPRHRPRKRFAQHFLAPQWAAKIVAAIAPRPGDVFLEIGPGPGALTLPLAATGVPILGVEIDRDLVADLAARAPRNVTIVSGNFLKTDVLPFLSGLQPQHVPEAAADQPRRRVRVIGNLPYNLSTPILFRLVELQQQHAAFADATVMLQREVADRLVAVPGTKAYGVLTIMLGLHAQITRVLDLPPGAFRPAPKVRSAVVRLEFRPSPVRIKDVALLERVVKRAFGQRRKTLPNALAGMVKDPRAVVEAAGIDPRRRPETLDLSELATLVDRIAERTRPVAHT
ncbi:MAG TPA: 16S rRNA (adenine(1518)-N(6)/adenine(1519)-N(6))-dimethyltransferase RsmA [Vicinamibacterales bacterium]|nr:16S rRNA (adenine(1518)-N(6)/adenine(1519)-N(6))-dimethyltransferase RsmA [Vicinamibacterales bacterium]